MTRYHINLQPGADLEGFREATRSLLSCDVCPDDVTWSVGRQIAMPGVAFSGNAPQVSLPRAVVSLIACVVQHKSPERYALLYSLIWRVRHAEPALLEVASDRLVHRLEKMQKSVNRDIHKMQAFLRFRCSRDLSGNERFIAWFEPEHFILSAVAPFFVERFRAMVWSIVSPIGAIHWDRENLSFGLAGRRGDVPCGDSFEHGWRDYYESTFNPARLNLAAMHQHMPRKYWRNMPETDAIPGLTRSSVSRVNRMIHDEDGPGDKSRLVPPRNS